MTARNLRTIVAAGLLATAVLPGLAAAEDAPAAQPASVPLAISATNSGDADARLESVVRDGDTLTVRVRFYAIEGHENAVNTLYSGINDKLWETEFYILAGSKKYLLLRDSSKVPLAPNGVMLQGGGPVVGTWYGVFPAPPAGSSAMIFLPKTEPLGPFSIPE